MAERELCGEWMPYKKELCALGVGHTGNCKTLKTVERDRARQRTRAREMALSARSCSRANCNEPAYRFSSGKFATECQECRNKSRLAWSKTPAGRESKRKWAKSPKGRQREGTRYRASGHEDLAYLYYSPGLQTHKIGHTSNLKVNERSLRRACWDIQLIETFPGGYALEQWLHDRFADRHVRLEWFRDLTATEVREAVAEWPGEANVA